MQTLEVWKEGLNLTESVYRISAGWPADERYGLISQVRRALSSIPTNLSEGVGRGSPAEAARFARIALGSAYEAHTLLHLAHRLYGVDPPPEAQVFTDLERLTKRLASYIQYQVRKTQISKSGSQS